MTALQESVPKRVFLWLQQAEKTAGAALSRRYMQPTLGAAVILRRATRQLDVYGVGLQSTFRITVRNQLSRRTIIQCYGCAPGGLKVCVWELDEVAVVAAAGDVSLPQWHQAAVQLMSNLGQSRSHGTLSVVHQQFYCSLCPPVAGIDYCICCAYSPCLHSKFVIVFACNAMYYHGSSSTTPVPPYTQAPHLLTRSN